VVARRPSRSDRPAGPDQGEKENVRVRSKIFGALAVGAMTAALTLVTGGGVAHAADPNTCSIQTFRGYYVTAVGAGGRTTDVMHTNATVVQSWEKFTLVYTGDGLHYGLRTSAGYYVTAVNSGGLSNSVTHDVLHTDATNLLNWEKFSLVYQNDGTATRSGSYGIRAFDGHYLSARDGGGRTTDTFESNRTTVDTWEKFWFNCNI
jgi:hypothetical protein